MRRMYFIGVTTASSSIHKIFPQWSRLAGIPDALLAGLDLSIGAAPERCRAAVEQIRRDPDAMGALVTTHKVALWTHTRDLFTTLDADAEKLGAVSCIVKRSDRLSGLATDTLTAGLALRAILGGDPFRSHALILGAGGAALALAVHLFREHQPARVILTDISAERIARVRTIVAAECRLVSCAEDHDTLLAALPPGSLIVNATGMGKDRPGSPITSRARFPRDSIAWTSTIAATCYFWITRGPSRPAPSMDGNTSCTAGARS